MGLHAGVFGLTMLSNEFGINIFDQLVFHGNDIENYRFHTMLTSIFVSRGLIQCEIDLVGLCILGYTSMKYLTSIQFLMLYIGGGIVGNIFGLYTMYPVDCANGNGPSLFATCMLCLCIYVCVFSVCSLCVLCVCVGYILVCIKYVF